MIPTREIPGGESVHPFVRLVGGCVLVIACLLVRSGTLAGTAAHLALIAIALCISRTALLHLVRVLGAGTLMYVPLFLLMPPGDAFKGFATAVVALTTVSSLDSRQLHESIVHLPLPGLARLLLQQIVHQSDVMRLETRRIHQAVAVRGGFRGAGASWMFVRSFPRVWLPRVVFKAHRVAMAMDLRGYGDRVPSVDPVRWGREGFMHLGVCGAAGVVAVSLSFLVPR